MRRAQRFMMRCHIKTTGMLFLMANPCQTGSIFTSFSAQANLSPKQEVLPWFINGLHGMATHMPKTTILCNFIDNYGFGAPPYGLLEVTNAKLTSRKNGLFTAE